MAKKNQIQPAKKFSEQTLTVPEQLSLFSLYKENINDYSHTVRLYDHIPKYFYAKPKLIEGRFLESFERDFEFNKNRYRIRVTPARIKDENGLDRDAYIGKREEIIEDALRKMAADGRRAKAIYLDGQFAVVFTRKALFDELSEMGHKYSYQQIEEAFDILHKTSIELSGEDGEGGFDKFHPFESYGIRGKNDENHTYVKFCPMVTDSIQNNTFRLINYKKLMGYKTVIARRLHKRMSNAFTQAGEDKTYHFSLNTVYRDFGLSMTTRISSRFVETKKSLEELKKSNVIKSYSSREVFHAVKKNKIVDYIFVVETHKEFIEEVLKANRDSLRRKNEANLRERMPSVYERFKK